jgi:hypothetical protein
VERYREGAVPQFGGAVYELAGGMGDAVYGVVRCVGVELDLDWHRLSGLQSLSH